jgi:hypothetical protein
VLAAALLALSKCIAELVGAVVDYGAPRPLDYLNPIQTAWDRRLRRRMIVVWAVAVAVESTLAAVAAWQLWIAT